MMRLLFISLIFFVKAKSQCDFTRYVDKFTGNISITGDLDAQISFAKFIRNSDTSYHICLKASGSEPCYNKKGVTVLIENSLRIERPNEDIMCKMKTANFYTNTAIVKLSKVEVDFLTKNLITDFRLYYTDKTITNSLAVKYRDELLCLLKQ